MAVEGGFMLVNSVSQVNFNANKVQILRNVVENSSKNRPYLYNQVVDLLEGKGMTAVFSRDSIEVSNPTKEFLKKIKELGIKFVESK